MKRHLPLLLLLSSCSADKAQVSVDLSGVYKKDGLSVVSNTKMEISRMRYVLVGPNSVVRTGDTPTSGPARQTVPGTTPGISGISGGSGAPGFEITNTVGGGERMRILRSADITPDPETLSFTIDAPAGLNRMLGLMAATTRDGKEHLAYLGFSSGIDLKPLVDTEVRVPVYPAGMVNARLSLTAASDARIKSTGYSGVLGCNLTLTRTEPLDGVTIERQTFASFNGYAAPEIPAGDAESIFGYGNVPLPTGDYLASCTMQTTIGELSLMKERPIRVLQGEDVLLEGELDLPTGPGATPPGPNARAVYFTVGTSDNLTALIREANIVSNTTSQVSVRARNLDGSLAVDFSGDVIIRFRRIDVLDSVPPSILVVKEKGLVFPVHLPGKASDPNNEYRTTLMGGVANLKIEADEDFLGLIEVVAVNPATGAQEPHNQGMALFSIATSSRCTPRPLDASRILAGGVNGHLPFVYTEDGALEINEGKPLDMHTLFGFLAPELTGTRFCVLDRFTSLNATADFPALKIAAPLVGNLSPLVSINQPGLSYNSIGAANGSGFATIPLRFLSEGQLMVPNTLRASDALTAADAASLELSSGFTTGPDSTGVLSSMTLRVGTRP